MSTQTDAAVAAYLVEQGIAYAATFVPQNMSRNSATKDERGNIIPSLNWRVSLTSTRASLTTDYMQGIGHVPGYAHAYGGFKTPYETRQLNAEQNRASMLGTYPAVKQGQKEKDGKLVTNWVPAQPKHYKQNVFVNIVRIRLPVPSVAAVLNSLILDADVVNYACFEDWADSFGYDKDNRSAERIYGACKQSAAELYRVFTRTQREFLANALQDY